MARKKNNHHLYIGRAGHLAAMAECLSRGWNVAIPEVDIGEDIFVVEDETSVLAKVQVKTATGKKIADGFQAQFLISEKQLKDTSRKGSDIRYIFVTRFQKIWQPFIIMTREDLNSKYTIEHIGTPLQNGQIKVTLYYRNNKTVECGSQKGFSQKGFPKPQLTDFVDKWDKIFTIRIQEGN